jgi:hypothetical protein
MPSPEQYLVPDRRSYDQLAFYSWGSWRAVVCCLGDQALVPDPAEEAQRVPARWTLLVTESPGLGQGRLVDHSGLSSYSPLVDLVLAVAVSRQVVDSAPLAMFALLAPPVCHCFLFSWPGKVQRPFLRFEFQLGNESWRCQEYTSY